MEANVVTGPAKNLLELGRRARPWLDLMVATYRRGDTEPENTFLAAATRDGFRTGIIPESGRFDRSVYSGIESLLAATKPDIVQTHNVKSHFLLRSSGLWKRYRWLAFHHGYTSTDLKMRAYNQLDRWSLHSACHVVTVCGPFEQQLRERGISPANITVQHNGVHPFEPVSAEERLRLREQFGIAPGEDLLVMIGRLSHEKGHVDLLQALSRATLARPYKLIILGEGPERAVIERTRAELGLDGRVILAGHQSSIHPYLAAADLYLMPSHSEGSPNALLEAMSAGLPVIACRVGGIPELVTENDTAILVAPRNPAELAAALERCLGDHELAAAMGQRARHAAASFSYDRYLDGMRAIYDKVIRIAPGGTL